MPPTILIRAKAACLEILAVPKYIIPWKLHFKTNAFRKQFSPCIIQHLTQRFLLILLSPQGPHSRLLSGVCFHKFHFSGRKLSTCDRGYLVQPCCKKTILSTNVPSSEEVLRETLNSFNQKEYSFSEFKDT